MVDVQASVRCPSFNGKKSQFFLHILAFQNILFCFGLEFFFGEWVFVKNASICLFVPCCWFHMHYIHTYTYFRICIMLNVSVNGVNLLFIDTHTTMLFRFVYRTADISALSRSLDIYISCSVHKCDWHITWVYRWWEYLTPTYTLSQLVEWSKTYDSMIQDLKLLLNKYFTFQNILLLFLLDEKKSLI